MKNWKDDFDKKAFEPENIDWRNYFSVDLKVRVEKMLIGEITFLSI
jgi:hypothetical protein